MGTSSRIQQWPFRRWVLSGLAMAGASVVLDGQAALVGCNGEVLSQGDAGCGAVSGPPCAGTHDACAMPARDACAVSVGCGSVGPCAAMVDANSCGSSGGEACSATDACAGADSGSPEDAELPDATLDANKPDAAVDAPVPDAGRPPDAGA